MTEDHKDVRKVDWTNKEVSCGLLHRRILFLSHTRDEKEHHARIYPARRGGSNAPYSYERCPYSDPSPFVLAIKSFANVLVTIGDYRLHARASCAAGAHRQDEKEP